MRLATSRQLLLVGLLLGPGHARAAPPDENSPALDLLAPAWTGKPPGPHDAPARAWLAPPDPAVRPATDRRVKLGLNPGPFVARFMDMPEMAPPESRDGPFDSRGALLNDGPNSAAYWRPVNDVDFSAKLRLDHRHHLMFGYALSARGRFTPRTSGADPAGPKLFFLQLGRRW